MYTLIIYYPRHTRTYTLTLESAVNYGKLAHTMGFDFDIKEVH